MYCPGKNGVGSSSNRTKKEARLSVSSERATRLALYCGASGSMTRWSGSDSSSLDLLSSSGSQSIGLPAPRLAAKVA
jgi:hypothetical protein